MVSSIKCLSRRLLCTLRDSIISPLKVVCFEVCCSTLWIFLVVTLYEPLTSDTNMLLHKFPFHFSSQKKLFQQEPSHDSVAERFLKTGQSVKPWKFVLKRSFMCSAAALKVKERRKFQRVGIF